MSNLEEKKAFRDKLNQVSPSFCMAKWLQVTMHLHSGHNHSCHHPNTHKTPLTELEVNASALHNSCFKKKQRAKMKEGKRPSECDYCWNIEDLGPSNLSDRTLKSSEFWSLPKFDEIANLPTDADVNPTYVEVSFSNVCNFRCSYCSGNFSSRWKDDIQRHGAYSTKSGEQTMEILEEDNNPYIKAFWDWWPSLVKDLKVFRITGGEPLLSKNTFRVLEDLVQNPKPDLEVAINSNLGVSEASFRKFIDYSKDLTKNKKVKFMRLFTSLDAWGPRAEYIRNGLELERFERYLEMYLQEVPEGQVTIMVTFNALSLTSFKDLLIKVTELKKKYTRAADGFCPLFIDISYMRHPLYQTIQVLPQSYTEYMEEICKYMESEQSSNSKLHGFYFFEIAKAQRTLEWMKSPLSEGDLRLRRKDFYKFFSEHDRRRQTDFLGAFPEMKEFWELCQADL
jgi:organic radical activating enzyme